MKPFPLALSSTSELSLHARGADPASKARILLCPPDPSEAVGVSLGHEQPIQSQKHSPAWGGTSIPLVTGHICTETSRSLTITAAGKAPPGSSMLANLENCQRNSHFSALPSPEPLRVWELTLALVTQAQQSLRCRSPEPQVLLPTTDSNVNLTSLAAKRLANPNVCNSWLLAHKEACPFKLACQLISISIAPDQPGTSCLFLRREYLP